VMVRASCHVVGAISIGLDSLVGEALVPGGVLDLARARVAASTAILLIVGDVAHFLLDLATASHNATVGLLVLVLVGSEGVHAVGDILSLAVHAVLIIWLSMIGVAVEVHRWVTSRISE